MASASSSSAPPKIPIVSCKPYDTFISYRGPDVKDTLAKQLHDLLRARGCRVFLDREEIEGEDSIPSAIHNAIRSSRVNIAIFSKGYADSPWCLDELVLMLQQTDILFIPLFYAVKPWELRHIPSKDSQYAAAFSHYQKKGRYLDKLNEWEEALASAANISGYDLNTNGDLCEKIVSRVVQEVEKKELHVAKYPIGLDELVQDFEQSCSKTRMVGIFGLGGCGKSTLAKQLFNKKRSSYHASCFLSDVREAHARGALECLQNQLIQDLFFTNMEKIKDLNIRSVDDGMCKLRDWLGRARHLHFLVILDDIDHQDQLDALLPEGMLSSGSMVIITTRDLSVLRSADLLYEMKTLDKDHAKELFCSHAFRGHNPPPAYEKLVESFVEYSGGLPLALIVLGAHVYDRDKYYWELELGKVKRIQPEDIMQRLKISFDGLDPEEKQIFIDIACFFLQKNIFHLKRKALRIWWAYGWSAEHALQTLEDKCLIKVVDNRYYQSFEMHNRLRDLGRQMADELDPPRLWRRDLLRHMEEGGFNQILKQRKGRCFHSFHDSSLQTEITYFTSESDLLWLELGNVKSIPSWIPLQKLQVLSVWNMEELWSTFRRQLQTNTQTSFELRTLNIFHSPLLQNLPDLIGMFGHLEELRIIGSLKRTDKSSLLGALAKLKNLRVLECEDFNLSEYLNLTKVRHLTHFEASKISSVTSHDTLHFYYLAHVSKLPVSGSTYTGVRSLKVELMRTLEEMDLEELETVNTLEVWRCPRLKTISGLPSLTGLQSLKVRACPNLETISGLSSLPRLQELCVEKCEGLKSLPTVAHLHYLERITISECHRLQNAEGFEELPRLKSLVLELTDDGQPWVRNRINGLGRFPSEYTILTWKAVNKASSILKESWFSKVLGAHDVAEIGQGFLAGKNESHMKLQSSSNAFTLYTLIVRGEILSLCVNGSLLLCRRVEGETMVTILMTAYDSIVCVGGVTVVKGIKATLKFGEEERVLTALGRIVGRLC